MANDVMPSGAPAGGGQQQLPPSSFDAHMAKMNEAPLIHGDPPGAGSAIKTPVKPPTSEFSSRVEQPPGAHAEPSETDPAELAAREELLRGLQNKPGEEQPGDPQQTFEQQAQAQAEFDAFQKFKASLSLPDEFHDKMISVPWGENGETRDVSIAEMRKGYMRTLDHTRKNQAAADMRRQAEGHMRNFNSFLGDLAGGKMREVLEDNGFGEQLQAAAEQIYEERLAEERHFYDLRKKGASDDTIKWLRERLAAERVQALKLRAQTRREQIMQQQLQQRQTAEQETAQATQLKNQLAQLRPAAFKHLGMTDDPMHQRAFQQQFIAILETGGGGGRPLREIVLDAAMAAKQLVEETKQQTQQLAREETARTREQVMPMSPQRLPGQSPRPSNGVHQAAPKRLGLNDFDAEMERQNGYRG